MEITDPREARMKYNEQDPMDLEDDEFDKLLPAQEENWQVVGPKHKHAITPISATTLPLPTSPARSPTAMMHSDQTNQKQPAKETTTHASTTREQGSQRELNYVHINDGTLRITVKWKPENFDELTEDKEQWNLAATDLIHWMYQTTLEVQIHSWKNGPGKKVVPILELNPDNLHSLIAPKMTTIASYKMFIFSIRVSLSSGPGRWINNPITKQTLQKLHVDVNISNSTSDSGDTIETAGYLFFKSPKYTHRHHYLKNLRSKLPPETPFFDIGYHRKTPTGQTIPHLAIKVGENHISTLTEILSAHLDGSQTTVFLGRLLISKMLPEEVDALFTTHADFIANTRILSLAPLVKNIDILRTEHSTHNVTTVERTTREWTASLRDQDGSSWKCDVENGSDNREAKLLVPLEHLEKARTALRKYKESIAPFSKRETTFSDKINQAHPTEIYIPTTVATNNLTYLQKLSSSSVWSTAPASIRSPVSATSSYIAPTFSDVAYPHINTSKKHPQPIDLTQTATHKSDTTRNKALLNPGYTPAAIHSDDTQTTHSMMTATMGTNQARFQELENAIKRQTETINKHQQEFKTVQTRFDELDNRTIKTMAFCQESSLQVMELRQEFAQMSAFLQQINDRLNVPQPAPFRPAALPDVGGRNEDDMSTSSNTSTKSAVAVHSPEKKKRRPRSPTDSTVLTTRRPPSNSPPPDQEHRAPQTQPSTPDQKTQ
jgi:hypothetical protein